MTPRETVTRDLVPPPPPTALDVQLAALRIWPFVALASVGANLIGRGWSRVGGAMALVGFVGTLVISRRAEALARRIHRG